ncbi:MAG: sulfatase-like hydrolase/transferase [Ferruginibacter sp.]
MFSRIFFIIKYWLLWILVFQLGRIAFLLFNKAEAIPAGFSQNAKSLWYGLRMDMSMAAYISIPILLFLLLGLVIPFFNKPLLYKLFTALVLFFVLLAFAVDINAYRAWGNRLDAGILKYLKNPREAYASVANLPVFWILLAFLLIWWGSFIVFKRFLQHQFVKFEHGKYRWQNALLLLLLMGSFIIPLRGGIQLAPLNQSSVYFSQNNFSNLAAINAPWNFLYTLNHHTNETENPFIYMADENARRITDSLYRLNPVSEKPEVLLNVIVIVWESFTEKATHTSKNGIEITPGFNRLKSEGVYFSDMYASGDRTDKGIVAILSGYPSQPTTSIVKLPAKAAGLPVLSKTFKQAGYTTAFYYGGELEFANMKAYLMSGAFDKYVTVNDFSGNELNSKWGAHDGVLMQKLMNGITAAKQPFFYTWLTLSSHEPFETPVKTVIAGTDDETRFLNSLHYTDGVLYDFIQQCKKQPWWSNTVLLIVADHGHRMPATGKKIDDFKIPMLMLGGGVKPAVIDKTGSQTDLAATLLSRTGILSTDFTWSKNLTDSASRPAAYFCFNNGFGFVNGSGYYIFDNVGKIVIERSAVADSSILNAGKAIQQLSYQDYLER